MGATRKIVQSGKIWSNRTSREVLWSIMKLQKVDQGVLRIVSADKKVDGCVALANGMYILGANTEGGATGYEAVKQLLRLGEATFQYIDYTNSDLGVLDQDLKIRVTQLINMLPNLPENMGQMQGTNTLNRIRAMDVEELTAIKKAAEAGVDQNVLQQVRQFEDKSMRWRALALWGTFAIDLYSGRKFVLPPSLKNSQNTSRSKLLPVDTAVRSQDQDHEIYSQSRSIFWEAPGRPRAELPRQTRRAAYAPRRPAQVKMRGRINTRPRVSANILFCTGFGAVKLTAPLKLSVFMQCRIAASTSSGEIQLKYCEPEPIGPPAPT